MEIEQIIKEVQQLSTEDLQILYKIILKQIAIPLQNPQMMYDDWENTEVDVLYADSW